MSSSDWPVTALSFGASSVLKDDSLLSEAGARDALLMRAIRGCPEALGELYDQYADKIYSYIYHRVGNAELAEDLTGQVFMQILEAIHNDRAWRTSFTGWLYQIARNLVIDHYRRRGRTMFIDLDEAAPMRSLYGDPAQTAETALDKLRLFSALDELPEEQAQVITLRFLEELSIAETAEVMGKSQGAIKAQQYRAILALKRLLDA